MVRGEKARNTGMRVKVRAEKKIGRNPLKKIDEGGWN